MKKFTIILVVVILLIALGVFGWFQGWFGSEVTVSPDDETPSSTDDGTGTSTDEGGDAMSEEGEQVIGSSANGNDITAYRFGTGDEEILFVGGIHGGYSWNTALLGYELVDWLEENPDVIPENVTVSVIPVLNPDGLSEVVGTTGRFSSADVSGDAVPGRFNGNTVDLNRNFDCNWESTGTWQSREVDAGSEPFSEPEAAALRDYIEQIDPAAAVVYYSAAGGVYASSCNGPVLGETQELMTTYADASGYPAEGAFDAYEVTGDAVDWMAKEGIVGISVLLETHDSVEWVKNRQGIQAVLQQYGN